jgi:hypothetical protein
MRRLAEDLVVLRSRVARSMGPRWEETAAVCRELIAATMAKNGCGGVDAVLKLCAFVGKRFPNEAKKVQEVFVAVLVDGCARE